MTSLRTLVVDDEEDGRSTLRNFLLKYCPGIGPIAEAASVREAVQQIGLTAPDLVFLDVNMPQENGLDLFRYIPEPGFQTIFVTAHDAYALQAIKQHALDYLLKPINIDELVAAVAHAQRVLTKAAPVAQQPGDLLQFLLRTKALEKLALPVLDGFVYVALADVIRCEADGNYTVFHFTNRGKLTVCRTLGSYESLLKEAGFLRVHHHHLINGAHIARYQRGRGGIVTMSDKSEVLVSQRRRDEFLRWVEGFGAPL